MSKLVSSHIHTATRQEPPCTPLIEMNHPKTPWEEAPPKAERNPQYPSNSRGTPSFPPQLEWNPESHAANREEQWVPATTQEELWVPWCNSRGGQIPLLQLERKTEFPVANSRWAPSPLKQLKRIPKRCHPHRIWSGALNWNKWGSPIPRLKRSLSNPHHN